MVREDFQSFVDELLARTDIVKLINGYVPLTKKGNNHLACCPFHTEKTPSFSVSSSKQFFYCFGCGEGGNSIGFVMKYCHVGFREAVEMLAEQAGMQTPQFGHPLSKEKRKLHSALYAVLTKAAALYVQNREASVRATNYLKKRGISHKTMEYFCIGYTKNQPDSYKGLLNEQCNEKLLLQAGLIGRNDAGITYDKFRNRIVFPIRDRRGQVVAFGGRSLSEEHKPKYINSPETPVFEKGKHIYGLYEMTKATRFDCIIVVEGYMDVIALFEHGINNVVATLGTAITTHQLRALLKICKKVVFCFDGDEAGRKAAERALHHSLGLIEGGQEIKFSFLPQGQDPDDIVKQGGAQTFLAHIAKSQQLSEFLFQHASHDLDLTSPEGQAGFIQQASAMVGKIKQLALHQLMCKNLAERSGISTELLLPQKTSAARQTPVAAQPRPHQGMRTPARTAIALLLTNPALAELSLADHELQQLGLKDIPLLVDLLRTIRLAGVCSGIALLERYRDSQYSGQLQQIYINSASIPDTESEFCSAMDKLNKMITQQNKAKEIQQLLRQQQQGTLSPQEQEQLRKLLTVQACQ